jgi:hypothetical protein
MSTPAIALGAPPAPRSQALYPHAAWYFAAATALTVAGFFPSYFTQIGHTDAVHHFHGAAATTWLLLLITQAQLASTRQFKLHRLLGWFSLVVAPALVISGLLVMRVMLEARNPFNRAFGARLAFLDVTTLIYFAVAYVLAIHHRREQPLHARWMASTAVIMLPPGLARFIGNFIPGVSSFEMAIHLTYAVCLCIAGLLLLDDRRKGGIRLPYVALTVTSLAQDIGFATIPHWDWWNAFAASFAVH